MTAARTSSLIALALLSGCSGDAAPAADGGHALQDGGFSPPPCEVEFGRSYVFESIAILPPDDGVDITGDGQPDNLLGTIAPLANPTIVDAIDGGTGIFLMDFSDWAGPPVADDPQVAVTFYLGVDAESPPDPSNNQSGDGEFLVVDRQFDVECRPLSRQEDGRMEAGVVYAEPKRWRFLVEGVGTLEYVNLDFAVAFDDDFASFSGRFGAGWSTCTMYRASGPLFAGGNMLATVVNNVGEPQADLDLDGDGLESFEGDGSSIVACIDGDGTRIEDPGCACDPRVADAYSVSVEVVGVPAEILGILHVP